MRKSGQLGEFKPIRRGWCLDEEPFRQELLAQMSERIGAEHCGEERAQTVRAKAERIITAGLKRRRWKEAELRARPEGDASKVALAALLRAETAVTAGGIAERLGMESPGYLNHLLYRRRKTGSQQSFSTTLASASFRIVRIVFFGLWLLSMCPRDV